MLDGTVLNNLFPLFNLSLKKEYSNIIMISPWDDSLSSRTVKKN